MLIPLIIKAHRLYGLTYRESQVTLLTAWGFPHKAIADILGISKKTVEKFLERIHERLSLSYTTQIVHRLIADGVIDPIKDWTKYTHNDLKKAFANIPQCNYQNRLTLMKEILANEKTTNATIS